MTKHNNQDKSKSSEEIAFDNYLVSRLQSNMPEPTAFEAWQARGRRAERSQERDTAKSTQEPAQWQARAGTGDWLNIAAHSAQTYEQINGFEVRALYVAPLDAQAIQQLRRYHLSWEDCDSGEMVLDDRGDYLLFDDAMELMEKTGEAG